MVQRRIPDAVRRLAQAVLDLEEYVEGGERPTAKELVRLKGCQEALRFLLYGELPQQTPAPSGKNPQIPDPRASGFQGGIEA